ncbi:MULTISPECIES: RNA polymerase sigma factor [Streptomyces]|uniref:RNA polymerase sigma factor n=1 Tax=Streptomyces TaxID=1883 RepID=UPI0006286766|nr:MULTISPECIES: sigma-70 family RNA polymerase sigma factor [Streptomyces]MDX2557275.1 sigma-70 family RNA polymerase sigma factor [Streptomyces stelliscabiei]MDX2616335.1 sigma-70 family RNA polymerase sigma factor [Streptomyces stelliscabiei]MDX2641036.1 sigma-70 family RNA polymerase sigma factor [Streptomyces stelliscabiei]MDX2665098.1 sigma-70 family RNA polymerase sigma factor [Streptomyces stelliscabiei]MDX2716227.1 sigma-70 family RNA polymerase sigma factor [Streptomyces stelliscabie
MTLQDQSGVVAPGLGVAGSPGPAGAVPLVLGEAEFGAFYHAYVEKLFGFLSRRTGRDVSKELADLVFEQFFVWWQQHPEQAEPVGMLFWLARCRLNDYLRRRGRELTVEPSDLQDLAGGVDGDDFAAVDRHHDLRKALATLTEQQRQALLMKYVANLSVAECAETLGTGEHNMKKILGKAREAVRQAPGMDAYNSAVTAKEVRG